MFGSLVNKNARAALKEFGDQKGLPVEFEMVNGQSSDSRFTAVARVGQQHFEPATANTKKDAKEFAADLALRAIQTSCESGTCNYSFNHCVYNRMIVRSIIHHWDPGRMPNRYIAIVQCT